MRVPRFLFALVLSAGTTAAQSSPGVLTMGDSVRVRLSAVDLRVAVEALAPFMERPVMYVGASGMPVTLETPQAVARGDVERLMRGMVESHGHELVLDTLAGLFRVRQREMQRPAAVRPNSESRGAGIGLHVIALQHARASDVAATINGLYGRGGSVSTSRGMTPIESAREASAPSPVDSPIQPRAVSLSQDLTLVADAQTNSLLVRATSAELELIQEVVRAVDVRPLQVLIEVLVAEVRRDRSLALSVEGVLGSTPVAGTPIDVSGGLDAGGLGSFALRVMGIGGVDAEATLRADAGRGNARILTRPVVLATNNQVAEIVVGSQRPFIQVQRSLPTDVVARDQVVQYKEVGTRLLVRPTVSIDGSVQLELTQEVSSATAEVAFDAPVISTRSVRTQLLVRDGQTVALGGLTDRIRERRQSGLPFLSAIPLLGGLFGSAERKDSETELFIFLTPRVIRTDGDAARLTAPLHKRSGAPRPRP